MELNMELAKLWRTGAHQWPWHSLCAGFGTGKYRLQV